MVAIIATVKLYDSAGNTLGTQTLDGDFAMANYNNISVLCNPFTEIKLREGNVYRMAVTNNSTSAFLNGLLLPNMEYADADSREICYGPGQLTTRTDAGSWTDTATKACAIVPVMKFITTARHRYF